MKAHEYYSRAELLAPTTALGVRFRSLAQLATGWNSDVSPLPAHRCIAERLTQPEGRSINRSLALLLEQIPPPPDLNKCPGCRTCFGETDAHKPLRELTVAHARLWQYMSCRLISQPAGLLQFQIELAILLEELASPSKPHLQLVPA